MRDGYDFPSPDVDVWVPFQLDPSSPNFGGHHIDAVARLAKGATLPRPSPRRRHLSRAFPRRATGSSG